MLGASGCCVYTTWPWRHVHFMVGEPVYGNYLHIDLCSATQDWPVAATCSNVAGSQDCFAKHDNLREGQRTWNLTCTPCSQPLDPRRSRRPCAPLKAAFEDWTSQCRKRSCSSSDRTKHKKRRATKMNTEPFTAGCCNRCLLLNLCQTGSIEMNLEKRLPI